MIKAKPRPIAPANPEFVMSRTFDVPREHVWQAFSEADRLAQWWSPKSFSLRIVKHDFQASGSFHYSMQTPDGRLLWAYFRYREIVVLERIVFIASFSNQQGGIARHPWEKQWPLEVVNALTFSEQEGRTTLLLRGIPINASKIERQTFSAGHDGMRLGFGATWDQLDEYLKQSSAIGSL